MKIRLHSTNDDAPSVVIPMGGTLVRNQPDLRQVNKGITRVYEFQRDATGALVAEVAHEGDLKRFLSLIDGFSPYGDEAVAEARETYKWTGEQPEESAGPAMASGQPAIVDEFVDDDDDDSEPYTGDDDDDDREPALQTGLSDIPSKDADGDAWIAYGKTLPGITNPKKQHSDLVQYAATNYGVDIKSTTTLKILQEIAALQAAA